MGLANLLGKGLRIVGSIGENVAGTRMGQAGVQRATQAAGATQTYIKGLRQSPYLTGIGGDVNRLARAAGPKWASLSAPTQHTAQALGIVAVGGGAGQVLYGGKANAASLAMQSPAAAELSQYADGQPAPDAAALSGEPLAIAMKKYGPYGLTEQNATQVLQMAQSMGINPANLDAASEKRLNDAMVAAMKGAPSEVVQAGLAGQVHAEQINAAVIMTTGSQWSKWSPQRQQEMLAHALNGTSPAPM